MQAPPLPRLAGDAPAAFVVLRASGHVGSRWLAELLATQDLAFLFEFPGRCSARRYPDAANWTLHQIFHSACACRLDAAMENVCASDEAGRIRSMGCVKDAFCGRRCPPQSRERACTAAGMIDSFQPALGRRIAVARAHADGASRGSSSRIAVVTFERDNAAKHAISKLRASSNARSGHMSRPKRSSHQ